MNTWTLHHSDCLDAMRAMPNDSVDSVVTDPPYGISFQGKNWDHGVPGKAFWEEALRVAKPGAHLVAFGGTRTYHRLACAIEDAGWEIRDSCMWLFGVGFPKSLDVGKALQKAGNDPNKWEGWGTALKPGYEPIILARKPFNTTVVDNVLTHGTGAINVGACRVGDEVLPEIAAGQAKIGTFERNDMVTPERVGRYPANVLLDEEAAKLVDEESKVEASRFFYCAKTSSKERGSNNHPTVKPLSLMKWLTKLVTPAGGLVLDPFAGSGTTLVAALEEGFNAVGVEREAEYVEIIRGRLSQFTELKCAT